MKLLRQLATHAVHFSGYVVLMGAHWHDPAALIGYALILTGASMHLLAGQTQRRSASSVER